MKYLSSFFHTAVTSPVAVGVGGCCSVNEKFGITPAAGLPDGLTRRHCVGKHDGYCETLPLKTLQTGFDSTKRTARQVKRPNALCPQ